MQSPLIQMLPYITVSQQANEPSSTVPSIVEEGKPATNAEVEEQVTHKEQKEGDSDAKDEGDMKIADDGVKEEMTGGGGGGSEGDNGIDDRNAHSEHET